MSEQNTAFDYSVEIDFDACTSCGLCEAFCPVDVFEMDSYPVIVQPEACWGCETCSGQCPEQCIKIIPNPNAKPVEVAKRAEDLGKEEKELYASWAKKLKDILNLRWEPVSISLIKKGEPLPDVPIPNEHMRYCQSLLAARRGLSIMLPVNRHACPDGTSILGLSEMPKKLASGELYILFHKLATVEAAQQMVKERPHLDPYTIEATVVTPLAKAKTQPEVIAVTATPEQMMWLSMATSYYTGHRHDFHASGYNAQCVEVTLLPYLNHEINISFGCYGCRASTDIGDEYMVMGIPVSVMPDVIKGLEELGKKAIPQSRSKIYLPPC
ncbi:MAG: DUF169 domain-containing protein [Coriobacteriia bacterium]|nr:DUF169 domain-containing protein [Coriobacteriia bacterium]